MNIRSKPLQGPALTLAALLSLAVTLNAQSADGHKSPGSEPAHQAASRAYLGQDIFVAAGQGIHNATCLFCSVQIDGDLSGHVFVLFGNLTVTGRIGGDATVFGGNTVVDSQARIGGRTTVIGGNAVYETDDALSGNAYVLGGHISSFAGRSSTRRRVSLSPALFVSLSILALLLLAAILFPRSRPLRLHR